MIFIFLFTICYLFSSVWYHNIKFPILTPTLTIYEQHKLICKTIYFLIVTTIEINYIFQYSTAKQAHFFAAFDV